MKILKLKRYEQFFQDNNRRLRRKKNGLWLLWDDNFIHHPILAIGHVLES